MNQYHKHINLNKFGREREREIERESKKMVYNAHSIEIGDWKSEILIESQEFD